MALGARISGVLGPSGLAKRAVIYVLGFGLGTLLLSWLFGFALVSLAEGLLPKASTSALGPVAASALPAPSALTRPGKLPPETGPIRRRPGAPRSPGAADSAALTSPGPMAPGNPAESLAQNPAGPADVSRPAPGAGPAPRSASEHSL